MARRREVKKKREKIAIRLFWYAVARNVVYGVRVVVQFYPWFKFFCVCFKLTIIHYHTPKQRKLKFEPRIKLRRNVYLLK